jgi:hypothetical protein
MVHASAPWDAWVRLCIMQMDQIRRQLGGAQQMLLEQKHQFHRPGPA